MAAVGVFEAPELPIVFLDAFVAILILFANCQARHQSHMPRKKRKRLTGSKAAIGSVFILEVQRYRFATQDMLKDGEVDVVRFWVEFEADS